jgi:hypothetical protein
MAADSASSFESGMVYQNADKIVNLMEGLPIGAMATGVRIALRSAQAESEMSRLIR